MDVAQNPDSAAAVDAVARRIDNQAFQLSVRGGRGAHRADIAAEIGGGVVGGTTREVQRAAPVGIGRGIHMIEDLDTGAADRAPIEIGHGAGLFETECIRADRASEGDGCCTGACPFDPDGFEESGRTRLEHITGV